MKKWQYEICENIIDGNISEEMFYKTSDFIGDCKAYIKALKAGRVLFVELDEGIHVVDVLIRSYEGTMKDGYYRDYSNMLVTLGFYEVGDYIRLPKDYYTEILTRLHGLELINEKKYIKLRDRLY